MLYPKRDNNFQKIKAIVKDFIESDSEELKVIQLKG